MARQQPDSVPITFIGPVANFGKRDAMAALRDAVGVG